MTHVIEDLGGGGAERVCVNLANAWATRGWDVMILTLSERSLVRDGVDGLIVDSHSPKALAAALASLRATIRRGRLSRHAPGKSLSGSQWSRHCESGMACLKS